MAEAPNPLAIPVGGSLEGPEDYLLQERSEENSKVWKEGMESGVGKETLRTTEMIPLRKCPDSKEKGHKFIS